MPEKKRLTAPACEGCRNWEDLSDSCWYFWENKKECTQHSEKKL